MLQKAILRNYGAYLLKSVILMKEKTCVTSLRMKKDGTWAYNSKVRKEEEKREANDSEWL